MENGPGPSDPTQLVGFRVLSMNCNAPRFPCIWNPSFLRNLVLPSSQRRAERHGAAAVWRLGDAAWSSSTHGQRAPESAHRDSRAQSLDAPEPQFQSGETSIRRQTESPLPAGFELLSVPQ